MALSAVPPFLLCVPQRARDAAGDEERAKVELADAEAQLKQAEEAAKEAAERASGSKNADALGSEGLDPPTMNVQQLQVRRPVAGNASAC